MSLKLECLANGNVTQIIMSLKWKCYLPSNWNVTQLIEISLKSECLFNLNVTQIRTSLKLKFHSNCNVTQIGMSFKFECHSNLKTKQIEKVENPKTSKSASIGLILILLFFYHLCHVFPTISLMLVLHIVNSLVIIDLLLFLKRCHKCPQGSDPEKSCFLSDIVQNWP